MTALACAVVPSFSGSAAPPAGQAQAAEGVADWTMMVYAVGDTSGVAQVMVENLTQLTALPDAPNVNVVMMLDLPERGDPGAPSSTLPGIGEFTTAKLLKLEGGRFVEIRDLGEVSMGRPDVLSAFIAEAADRFPAEKYGLTAVSEALEVVFSRLATDTRFDMVLLVGDAADNVDYAVKLERVR